MADRTDWAALRAMSEEEIKRMAVEDEDNPATDEEHWRHARVGLPSEALTEDQAAKLRALDDALTRGIADAEADRVKPNGLELRSRTAATTLLRFTLCVSISYHLDRKKRYSVTWSEFQLL